MLYKGVENLWVEFSILRNWGCFGLYLNNQLSYGKMDGTSRFSASIWSKANPLCCSDCKWWCCTRRVEKLWVEFFAFRNWKCFCLCPNNQQCHGKMEATVGLSRSERSRNTLGRSSNYSGRMLYNRENKWLKL